MKINHLRYDEVPFTYEGHFGALNLSLKDNYDKDENGIPIRIDQKHTFIFLSVIAKKFEAILNANIYPGQVYYHPGWIARKMLPLMDAYVITRRKKYLNKAKTFIPKLLEQSIEINGALFFKHDIETELHGIRDQVMKPPWYSGMNQGQILSAFVRMYNITKNKKYLEISEKIFRSFKNLKGKAEPWVVYIDDQGYLWIEEYPMDIPCNTLNGFIFGIFGIYDYYLLKKDKESKDILIKAIKTIKHYISQFRNKGDISYYCLKHKKKILRYHRIHIEQLELLYKITSDDYFQMMAKDLYNDKH